MGIRTLRTRNRKQRGTGFSKQETAEHSHQGGMGAKEELEIRV